MEIINQIGHLQHWGLSPALNFLAHYQHPTQSDQRPVRVLLTGTSDIRHILKTITDIDITGKLNGISIEIYFHEIHKELICRALLFLHILHEAQLNYDERIELFLDLYGNALIKERNSRYLDNVRKDLLDFIHSEKNVMTPLRKFVSLKMLKFQEQDELSEFMQSWSSKAEFPIQKLRDQRLRCLFKERYDYKANLVDWDFNMLLSEFAPLIHFYHYREWRLTGLAFQQRFSTYTVPNRTLASYVPGRRKQERTSCLVRGYWGDMVVSPYISMGIDTNSDQKQLLFKKANMKYVGHSVELTEYNLRYWLQRIQSGTIYSKQFRDYYRTDEDGRKKLEQQENQKKKKKERQGNLKAISEDPEQQKQEEGEAQAPPKQQEEEELDSEDEEKKAIIDQYNSKDIQQVSEDNEVLHGFRKYGVQILPASMPIENFSKPKFKQLFDVVVIGFVHSAYLTKGIQETLRPGGQIILEKSRYVVPKKKAERKQIHEKLANLVTKEAGFEIIGDNPDYYQIQKHA